MTEHVDFFGKQAQANAKIFVFLKFIFALVYLMSHAGIGPGEASPRGGGGGYSAHVLYNYKQNTNPSQGQLFHLAITLSFW